MSDRVDISLDTREEVHNLLTGSVTPGQLEQAANAGIGIGTIFGLLLKWGPMAAKILQDLIDSILRHTTPPSPTPPKPAP